MRVMVETEVTLNLDANASDVAERTTRLGCEDPSVLPAENEWSLGPLWCRTPRTKLMLIDFAANIIVLPGFTSVADDRGGQPREIIGVAASMGSRRSAVTCACRIRMRHFNCHQE